MALWDSYKTWRGPVAVLIIYAGIFLQAPASAQTYTVRNLGTQLGHTQVLPQDINDKGEVTGYTRNAADTERRGFFIGPPYSLMTTIGAYEDYPFSYGYAINNHGVVVGDMGKSGEDELMIIWSNGVLTTFINQIGETKGFCRDINDNGLITGYSNQEGFEIQNGQIETLPILAGNMFVIPLAVNRNGIEVGYAADANLTYTATKWVGGVPSAIPNLGGENSQAHDIADNGLVVGWSEQQGSNYHHAMMVPEGSTAVDLGSFSGGSEAYATDGTAVVGYSNSAMGLRAFIYENNTMTDLNDLIPTGSGWTLNTARGINNYGQICGYGDYNGDTRGFVLTPIEPQGGAADWIFTERDNGWTAETSIPPFEPVEAAWVQGQGYGIRATGFPAFGYLQSPEVPLLPARSYRLYVQIATTAMAQDAAPQIRFRALQTGNNQSELLSLDSTNGVIPSGGATAYEFVFTPLFSGALPNYRFYLDLTFFDPFDEQDAWVYLQRVILAEE